MPPSTPDQVYSAAIVGLGFIGAGDQVSGDALGQKVANLDGTHAAALAGHPQVRLAAGSSRDAGRRERFAATRPGVRTYDDWRQMLAVERPQIVSVATYCPQHAEVTVAAAESGARVIYCEKPMAAGAADGRRMIEACVRAGALLVINHNRRFNPNYRRLRDLVATGGLGELTSVSLQWSTGRLANVGTHMIDAVMMLTGRQVEAVSGRLDLAGRPDCRGAQFHDPGGFGLLVLEGGLVATVDAADHARCPHRIQLCGTVGQAVTGRDEVTIQYWDGRHEHWPGTRAQATSMSRAVAEIVQWLDSGSAPDAFSVSPADSLRTHEAIIGLHLSHEQRAAMVDLPLDAAQMDRRFDFA